MDANAFLRHITFLTGWCGWSAAHSLVKLHFCLRLVAPCSKSSYSFDWQIEGLQAWRDGLLSNQPKRLEADELARKAERGDEHALGWRKGRGEWHDVWA